MITTAVAVAVAVMFAIASVAIMSAMAQAAAERELAYVTTQLRDALAANDMRIVARVVRDAGAA